MDVHVNSDDTCKLYNSCKYTKTVTLTSAMSTAVGFVKFQGYKAKDNTCILIEFLLETKGGMTKKYDNCNNKEKKTYDDYEINNKCDCNSCIDACDYKFENVSILNGFKVFHIILVYLIIVVLTVIIIVVKKITNNNKIETNEEMLGY